MYEQQEKWSIVENTTTVEVDNPNEHNCIRRWRKCAPIVEEFVYQLNSTSTGLTIGERKVMLRWFAENSQIIGLLLLEFLKNTKATEEKLKFVSSVQQAYIQMVANKSIENSVHKIALLLVVVSSTDDPNQLLLACTLTPKGIPTGGEAELQNWTENSEFHQGSVWVGGLRPTHKLSFQFSFGLRPEKAGEINT